MTRIPRWRRVVLAGALAGGPWSGVCAQDPVTEPAPAAAPGAAPAPAAKPPAAPGQRIEITGGRASDGEQRRQSTATKIVIGRDEIERFGDSNTLEMLKRLPGVTVPGAPGRGGAPRMRGMGGGYTQILVDGERTPPRFSLDAVPPEQIERIEILRAPTAETGARAIAGTINIVLREGFRKKLNDLNLAVGVERALVSPSLSWTRNDTIGDWIVNGSLSLFERRFVNSSRSLRTDEDLATGQPVLVREGTLESREQRRGVHASARVQWRDEQGTSLMLQPLMIASRSTTRSTDTVGQTFGVDPPDHVRGHTATDGRFALTRLNANYNHRVGDRVRLEWRAGLGNGHWRSTLQRLEFDAADALTRRIDESTDNRDRNATLSLKASAVLGSGHHVVSGLELERNRRNEGKSTLWDGVPQLTEFGEDLSASSRRHALYVQDEWAINPQWALHGGLRIEGITTQGEDANGVTDANTSRVATPLLHAVWKPDAQARDQLRASLTRSYRAPSLGQLIGRPSLNRLDPPPGANSELSADSAGNADLRPEVALGLDLAIERYLADGGVLSANLFHRRIADLIRNVVSLEDVSWSPGQPRFVSRPQNIGKATTQGLELEAKFRLDQLVDDGPRTEVRANASLFRSKVDAIPGPDNRIAEQPGRTVNLGADHRFRGTPVTIGANWNHTPGYRTRLDADRTIVQSEKNAVDAFVLWAFTPEAKLRLSLSNLLALDTVGTTSVQSGSLLETSRTAAQTHLNAQLRLELRL
ncbi:MAG: TonB-dependent receptor [Aquincola sp.]|nr:TonB-dependent receptor [Aquincola sp.]MDH5329700.1 TonB-dependent receptor [Aquincola sp.]